MNELTREIAARNLRMRSLLEANGIGALIVTNRETFEYFTGFRTLLWASAARPYFAVITPHRDVPTIVCAAIETRNAEVNPGNCEFIFYRGFIDDALTNLSAHLRQALPVDSRIALDYGEELFGRGSLALNAMLQDVAGPHPLIEAGHLVWELRCIKSELEIELKRTACRIATDAFFDVLPSLHLGDSERDFATSLSVAMLKGGAESIDWLPVRFGTGGFPGPRHPTARAVQLDDFLWTDMGCSYEGYLSDLSRVAKAGDPTPDQQAEYRRIRDLTLACADVVRAGMTCEDVAREFELLESGERTAKGPAGRMGHGSGRSLTEPPSIMFGSHAVIREGMVLHVEPRSEIAGGVFQVEEVFVVRSDGIEFLSDLSPTELPVIDATTTRQAQA